MKNCSEIIELMSLYIDNELDSETRTEFEEHIETCESCKSELYELKEIVGALGSIEEVELPSGFKEELHQKLVAEKNSNESNKKTVPFKKKFIGFASSIAAGLVLVFVAGSLIINRGLLGNAPKENNSGLMLGIYEDKATDETVFYDGNQSNQAEDNGSPRTGIQFNKGAEEAANEKRSGGSDNSKKEGTNEFADASSYSITPSSKAVSSEEPGSYGIAAVGSIPAYDAYITINSKDIEKEVDNIINIARSCNIEIIEDIIEVAFSSDSVVSSPDGEKKVLSFNADDTAYDNFVSKLKDEYGNALSFEEKTDDPNEPKKS